MQIDSSSSPGGQGSSHAPTLSTFDITRLDHLSGDLDTLTSLIWVAIDLVADKAAHGENLLHAALNQAKLVEEQISSIHSDLVAIQQEANHA